MVKLDQCNRVQLAKERVANQAAMSQKYGYAALLLLGQTIDETPDDPLSLVLENSDAVTDDQGRSEIDTPNFGCQQPSEPLSGQESSLSYAALTAQLSPEQLRTRFLAEVETEIAIWLGTGVLPIKTDRSDLSEDSTNIVSYWRNNGEVLPLIHRMAVDVPPAQASSVSSERVFSWSKLACTRERNHISSELVEALQIVKYSVRQQRSTGAGSHLLDFGERIAPLGDDIVE